jgi:uncharacterized damage-inducible protein DinB/predicted RNase H-like HicB family nuclease
MTIYPAYLETAADGRCLAHVLVLPGCFVRAPTRDEAVRRLPDAIRDYHGWLARHGEPVLPSAEVDRAIEVQVAGESSGFGPFDPGDAAALFPPDREPITAAEMERYARLMALNRADLLALVQDLADELLDWQPYVGSFSIRRVLRHVGNAEEWYVSRLVPPATLPPEWEGDEALPLFEFLKMERRTAIDRLRQLTEEERAMVFYPAAWTDHPDEPWTARKALRRCLEHEREHTGQVREVLAARRRWLLARLAAERAGLLEQLLDLDERTLTQVPGLDGWTVLDLLAHVAAWDRWEHRIMHSMVAGDEPDFTAMEDFDAANALFVSEWRNRAARMSPVEALDSALAELHAARAEWIAWLASLPQEEFFRPRSYHGDDWTFSAVPLEVQDRHDSEHAGQIAAWRQAAGLEGQTGPKAVLLAALDAARQELLAACTLVPPEERSSRPVCGEWTLQDVLGHVADWESFGVEGLRHMAAGLPPQVENVEDIDGWNRAHVQVRRGESWEVAWDDLHRARQALLNALAGMSQDDWSRTFPFPWGGTGNVYQWVRVYLSHDREHAHDVRGKEEKP